MASGKVHLEYHNKAIPIVVILSIIEAMFLSAIKFPDFSPIVYLVVHFIYYVFIGEHFIGPDNDILGLSSSDGRMLEWRKKSIFIGFIFLIYFFWWTTYSWLIWKHRSIWSHGIFIGTLGRFIWVLLPFVPTINFIGTSMGWTLSQYYYEFYAEYYLVSALLAIFMSMFWSDLVHLILDSDSAKGTLYIPETEKRRNRKNGISGNRNIQDRPNQHKEWIANFRNYGSIFRSVVYKRHKKVVYKRTQIRTRRKNSKNYIIRLWRRIASIFDFQTLWWRVSRNLGRTTRK